MIDKPAANLAKAHIVVIYYQMMISHAD